MLPRSLRSMVDVRAARTEEKIGHSGRDDSERKASGRVARATHYKSARRRIGNNVNHDYQPIWSIRSRIIAL